MNLGWTAKVPQKAGSWPLGADQALGQMTEKVCKETPHQVVVFANRYHHPVWHLFFFHSPYLTGQLLIAVVRHSLRSGFPLMQKGKF
jgi:hypothetical protein